MRDIVERLRDPDWRNTKVDREAADEIEKLRLRLAELGTDVLGLLIKVDALIKERDRMREALTVRGRQK